MNAAQDAFTLDGGEEVIGAVHGRSVRRYAVHASSRFCPDLANVVSYCGSGQEAWSVGSYVWNCARYPLHLFTRNEVPASERPVEMIACSPGRSSIGTSLFALPL